MDLNDKLHAVSSIILTTANGGTYQGTGFYYARTETPEGSGPQWVKMDDLSIVTNRHVLIPRRDGVEMKPTTIAFGLRTVGANGMNWDQFVATESEIARIAKFHQDKTIDVAILDISEILKSRLQSTKKLVAPFFLGPSMFVGKNNIEVEASDDVLVVGYPKGFYDRVNLFPIIKSGIIATKWGVGFEGKPQFLIDAKLFPGSSGSVVLSKPIDMVFKDGKLMSAKDKQFALLGVYSGEPILEETPVEVGELTITRKSGFDLGTVWYAELIEEILDNGADITEAMSS